MKLWQLLLLMIGTVGIFAALALGVVEETSTYRIECTPDVATIKFGGFNQYCTYQLKTGNYTGDVAFCFDTTINSAKVIYNGQTDITSLFKYKRYEMLKGDCYYIEDAFWNTGEVKTLDIYYLPNNLSKSPKWDTYFGDISTNRIDLKLDPVYNTTTYEIGTTRTGAYYWMNLTNINTDISSSTGILNYYNATTIGFPLVNSTINGFNGSGADRLSGSGSIGIFIQALNDITLIKINVTPQNTTGTSFLGVIDLMSTPSVELGYFNTTTGIIYSDISASTTPTTINITKSQIIKLTVATNNRTQQNCTFGNTTNGLINMTGGFATTDNTRYCGGKIIGATVSPNNNSFTKSNSTILSNNITMPILINNFYLNGTNYTGNASLNITFDGTTWTWINNLTNTSTITLSDNINDNNRMQYKLYLNNNQTTINTLIINYFGVINTINITIRDETTGALILQNVTMTSYNFENNITNNVTTATGYINLANQTAGLTEYIFQVVNTSQGYSVRKIVYEVSNSSSGTFTIYLLNNQNYTIFTYFDKLTTGILSNVLVEQQTFVNGSLVTVDSRLTDVTGLALFYYRPNVAYQFVSSKDDYADKIFSLNPIISTAYNIYMTSTAASYDNPNRTQYSLTYDPITKLLTIDYAQADTHTNTIMLNVLLYNQTRTTTICNITTTNTTGTFYCDLSGYSRTVHIIMYDDDFSLFATYLDIGKANIGELLGQGESSVWAFFIYLTIVLAGILGGIVTAIVASILGLWIISTLGILSAITTAAVILSAIVGVIILYLRK